jgi:hypothetical protein
LATIGLRLGVQVQKVSVVALSSAPAVEAALAPPESADPEQAVRVRASAATGAAARRSRLRGGGVRDMAVVLLYVVVGGGTGFGREGVTA